MLGFNTRDDLYEELCAVFKRHGFDFTRYEIFKNENTNSTQIQVYFQAYGKPYGLSYEWSQYVLQEFSNLNLKLMLMDYLHKQLKAIDKTEAWELVPKT